MRITYSTAYKWEASPAMAIIPDRNKGSPPR